MSDYTPDRWVVIKITAPNVLLYKVFAQNKRIWKKRTHKRKPSVHL